jgi:ribose/xylose/arabinose/galactoside ABC-type transport system permease subunit
MTVLAPQEQARFSPRRRSPAEQVRLLLHRHPALSPLAVLVASSVVFGLLNSRFFLQINLSLITQQVAVVGTLAIGETLIILTAGIDLSVGAAMILAQMVMAQLAASNGIPGPLALLIGIVVGAGAGLLNGALVTRIKLPPFIVTLGTYYAFTAIGLLYANGATIEAPQMPGILNWTGNIIRFQQFGLSTGVLIMIVLYAVIGYTLSRTAWGRHVYAVGDDVEAARLAGIRTDRVLLSVYLVAGVIFGLAAWILIGRVGAASTNSATNANLDAITAVVIGGTSLFGGRGRVLGTLFGALIVGVFQNGLVLAGVQDLYQSLAEGILVVVAVGLDQWIRKVRR